YRWVALRLAHRFTGRQNEAEDFVQEAFLQVHLHADQYNPEIAPFKNWFFAILSNLCRNAVKKTKGLSFVELPKNAPAIDDPMGDLVSQERRAALAVAFAKLPHHQRSALILRYEDGFSYAEMSAELGLSIKAVGSLLARAKRTLRLELSGFEK